MNQLKRWAMRLTPLIGLLLFLYFLSRVNLAKVLTTLENADMRWIAIGLSLVVVEVLLKAARFKILIRSITPASLGTSVWVYLLGQPFGAVTPGQLGDFIKYVPLTRRAGISLAEGLAVGVIEKMLDVSSLLLAGALGVYLALTWHGILPQEFAPLAIGAAALALIIIAATYHLWRGIARRASEIVIQVYRAKLTRAHQATERFAGALGLVAQQRLALALLLSLAAWMVIAARAAAYGAALGLGVNPPYYFILVPAGIIAELLPISFMGIGVREYSLWFLFSPLGVSLEGILSLSLLHFVFGPLPTALAGTVLVLQLERTATSESSPANSANESSFRAEREISSRSRERFLVADYAPRNDTARHISED